MLLRLYRASTLAEDQNKKLASSRSPFSIKVQLVVPSGGNTSACTGSMLSRLNRGARCTPCNVIYLRNDHIDVAALGTRNSSVHDRSPLQERQVREPRRFPVAENQGQVQAVIPNANGQFLTATTTRPAQLHQSPRSASHHSCRLSSCSPRFDPAHRCR